MTTSPCGDVFSYALGECPNCGWKIPKQEVERVEAEERERKMHEERAAQLAILGSEPEELKVDSVTIREHKKADKPSSLKVQYRCGIRVFCEWICLDHKGFPGQKARRWWARRFGPKAAKIVTVKSALGDLFTSSTIAELTESITVVREGKHSEIVGYGFRDA